jgi:hypothetical protein
MQKLQVKEFATAMIIGALIMLPIFSNASLEEICD